MNINGLSPVSGAESTEIVLRQAQAHGHGIHCDLMGRPVEADGGKALR